MRFIISFLFVVVIIGIIGTEFSMGQSNNQDNQRILNLEQRVTDQERRLTAQEHRITNLIIEQERRINDLANEQNNRIADLEDELNQQLSNRIMAFDQLECPDGWERFQAGYNRFLMVAEDASQVGQTGGNERTTLTISQMPRHRHSYDDVFYSEHIYSANRYNLTHIRVPGRLGSRATDYDNVGIQINRSTGFSGSGQSFSNLPPYIALTFCRKTL